MANWVSVVEVWTTAATPAVSSRPANIQPKAWVSRRCASSVDGRTPSCDGVAPNGLFIMVRSS